jgi:TldD protein
MGVRVVVDGAVGFAATVDVSPPRRPTWSASAMETARVTAQAGGGRVELAPEPSHGEVTWTSAFEIDPGTCRWPTRSPCSRSGAGGCWPRRRLARHRRGAQCGEETYPGRPQRDPGHPAAGPPAPQVEALALERFRLRDHAHIGPAGRAGLGVPDRWRRTARGEGLGLGRRAGAACPSCWPRSWPPRRSRPASTTSSSTLQPVAHHPRVDRARHRARPGRRLRGGLRRHLVRHLRQARHVGLRLAGHARDRRPHGGARPGHRGHRQRGRGRAVLRPGPRRDARRLSARPLHRRRMGWGAPTAAPSPTRRSTCRSSAWPTSRWRLLRVRMAASGRARGPPTELIAGVDRGLYIVGDKSWSIDMQRYNFQFTGQRFFKIEGGKLAGQVKDVAYQATTTDFWGAMEAVGGASTYVCLGGAFNCGKGQPGQVAPVSPRLPVGAGARRAGAQRPRRGGTVTGRTGGPMIEAQAVVEDRARHSGRNGGRRLHRAGRRDQPRRRALRTQHDDDQRRAPGPIGHGHRVVATGLGGDGAGSPSVGVARRSGVVDVEQMVSAALTDARGRRQPTMPSRWSTGWEPRRGGAASGVGGLRAAPVETDLSVLGRRALGALVRLPAGGCTRRGAGGVCRVRRVDAVSGQLDRGAPVLLAADRGRQPGRAIG